MSDPYAFKLVPGTTWERLLHSLPSFCRWLLRHGSAAHKAVMVSSRNADPRSNNRKRSTALAVLGA